MAPSSSHQENQEFNALSGIEPVGKRTKVSELESMAPSSSSHQENQELNAFPGLAPAGKRRKVSESSKSYDVFINHRGPDVKQTLATQLYNSLQLFGIRAFLDSEEKELGSSFPSTIETAIRSAKVHIAIFSKRYAESAWCLAELVLMLQSEAKIIPLFYEVEPWEVRHIEKGVYAEAFIKYEEKGRYLEKLNEWKEALHHLSFTAGEQVYSDRDCQKIVAAVQIQMSAERDRLFRAENDRLQAQLSTAQMQLVAAQVEQDKLRDRAHSDVQRLCEERDIAKAERDRQQVQLSTTQTQLVAAQIEHDRLRVEKDRAHSDVQRMRQERDAAKALLEPQGMIQAFAEISKAHRETQRVMKKLQEYKHLYEQAVPEAQRARVFTEQTSSSRMTGSSFRSGAMGPPVTRPPLAPAESTGDSTSHS